MSDPRFCRDVKRQTFFAANDLRFVFAILIKCHQVQAHTIVLTPNLMILVIIVEFQLFSIRNSS